MSTGQWTRWGRGSCEGWSLEIGNAFRGAVVKRQVLAEPPTWIASVNTTALGDHLDRDTAMKEVEARIASDMQRVLHDWNLYQAAKQKK
jgi:hypothetical protein